MSLKASCSRHEHPCVALSQPVAAGKNVSFKLKGLSNGPDASLALRMQFAQHWKQVETASETGAASRAPKRRGRERSPPGGERQRKLSPDKSWHRQHWHVMGAISRAAIAASPEHARLRREQAIEAERARRAAIAHRKLEFARELTRKNTMQKELERKHYAALRSKLARMERRTVNPTGWKMLLWDRTMLLAMFWTATLTPFEIGFMSASSPDDAYDWALFLCNRVIDLIFIVDLVLTFFVPYRESPRNGGRWVYDRQKIANRYLSTWFTLDAFTAIPTDLLLLLDLDVAPMQHKMIRFTRTLKLLRLVRLSRIMKRLLSRSFIDPSLLELLKFFALTMMTAHWLACMWGFEGNNYSDNSPIDISTWYVESYTQLSWVQKHQLTSASPPQLYGVALFVSLSNIFGGPTDISPANYYEFYLQGFMMLVGSSLWAYIIGCFCSILASLNPASDEHRRTVGMLNHFCRDHAVPTELARALRTYFNETNRVRYYGEQSRELLGSMTNKLRGEASLAAAVDIFPHVPYFHSALIEPVFLSKAALALVPLIIVPGEVVASDSLSIVFSGLVAKNGRCGIRVFGEDMVLNTTALRKTEPAMALTFTQLQQMARARLDELLSDGNFVMARQSVRRWCIRLTLQRVILFTAEFARKHMGQGDVCELQVCFERARQSLGLVKEEEAIYSVRKSPLEARIDEVDASVAALGKTVQQSLGSLAEKMGALADVLEKVPSRHRSSKRHQSAPPSEPTKSPSGKQRGNGYQHQLMNSHQNGPGQRVLFFEDTMRSVTPHKVRASVNEATSHGERLLEA